MRLLAVVNEKARRGGVEMARELRKALPKAEVVLTRSLDEVDALARDIVSSPPDWLVGAGGDGTSLALVNAVRRAKRASETPGAAGSKRAPLVSLAHLKLGTGNGWANVVGAPSIKRSLEVLARAWDMPLPRRSFDLVELEGLCTHFAGTGWDAELVDDFHSQKTERGILPRRYRYGVAGYLNGLVTRTIPRNLRLSQVEIEIENRIGTAFGIDARGLPYELPDTEPDAAGRILYRGPSSVCGVGTTSQWGFGFKAFPFAGLVRGRFNLRMYGARTTEAVSKVPLLWAGKHPLSKMHTWLLRGCTVRFSRTLPLQIGGDLLGHRDEMTYTIADEYVDVLDWRTLLAETEEKAKGLRRLAEGVIRPAQVLIG